MATLLAVLALSLLAPVLLPLLAWKWMCDWLFEGDTVRVPGRYD